MYRPPTRRNSAMSESDYGGGLEMAQARRLDEIGEMEEVPESVSRCLLFTLPREIRDRVYAFCLMAREREAVEWPVGGADKGSGRRSGMAPELLRTCKIVAAEATRALYAENRLAFFHPSDANMFVRAMASPGHTRHLAHLLLHVRAQDTRLWMPYLTSTDLTRSLKADFPNLRDLGIQYRSNKWQAALPVEANLRHWSEDGRLDELINGLGHVFWPGGAKERAKRQRRGSENSMDRWSDDETPSKARNAAAREPPAIKLIVSCRIPNTHFAALTSDLPLPPPQAPAQPAPAQLGAPPGTIHGVPPPPPPAPGPPGNAAAAGIAALQDLLSSSPPAPEPVSQGEEFKGFTIVDFKGRAREVRRKEREGGQVARTVFARKANVMVALEVFTS